MRPFDKRLFPLLLLAGLLTLAGCVKDVPFRETAGEGQIRLLPAVQGLSTKSAPGEDARDENNLGDRLDVFFRGADSGNADFWKEYHLSGCTFTDPSGELLSENWKNDGFQATDHYNVYVIVNGPDAVHGTVGSFLALQHIALTDADIPLVKSKAGDYTVAESGRSYYTSRKSFLMDGVCLNWSPVPDQSAQTVTVPDMRRAAAKIVVNISFDNSFLSSLLAGGEKPGYAMFKYDHFAFSTPVLTGGDAVTPDIRNSEGLKYANVNVADDATPDYHYGITTYSYACTWTAGDAVQNAPCVLVSIPMVKGTPPSQTTTYHYYRIPVRSSGAYSLERNHLYTVNAVIDTKGSYSEAGATIPVHLAYSVLEWTEDASEETDVNPTVPGYFSVTPVEKALWGGGTQTAVLQFQAPLGASITIEPIPSADLSAAGATMPGFAATQTAGSAGYQAFYIDSNDTAQAATVSGISVDASGRTITVSSAALANNAPKYIRFRVVYEKNTANEMYEDVYIRHFPTTQIQNMPGWFSYLGETTKETTFKPATDGWSPPYEREDEFMLCPDKTTFDGAEDPDAYFETVTTADRATKPAAGTYSWIEGPVEINRDEFIAALTTEANRRSANGQANAIQGGSGAYLSSYYYGTDPALTTGTYDYTPTDWANMLRYKYGHYYKVTYYAGYAHQYYRYTGDFSWVRWIPDSVTPYSGTKTLGNSHMSAKVYDFAASDPRIHLISQTGQGGGMYLATQGAARPAASSNNRIYVIQTSEARDGFALGRPLVDPATYKSDDNLVSPAFMLASQLGDLDTGNFNGDPQNAPRHCRLYAEATKQDGANAVETVYTGWRLPTASELALIVSLQQAGGDALGAVLSLGNNYGCLDGNFRAAGTVSSPQNLVRCVRDLSPLEVAELNNIK